MARNRKNHDRPTAKAGQTIDIPEHEQWRIIKESGVLKQIPQDPKSTTVDERAEDEEEGLSPFAEEVFNSMMLVIPMSFMLLLMEILVHFQYGRQPDYLAIFKDRMLASVPIISVFIFYSNRYKSHLYMQAGFFVLACIVGPRLVWLINRGNWLVVMRQSPPLATAWIYAIVQLNLLPAALNLIIVLGFGWYKGLKLIP
ncbi:hypothetical protein DICSQDRAFT_83823 [Dichomitus squalens LYAD-421 SS1]|uniref:uncharacterized protein n=1 Tax=Dichomitus squalens (strain LYAD-421) TaxID=732165 RepID=UPI0004410B66|nr:uncharacterized protein DICSQDRAFT_83823 [Dichomitus squalens LYAD-421 SS1]EJF63001.1 hypothetical protein DICSQDRAFT_83823 [Dichomitus squalens LYAD-421 SS1]